MTTNRHTLLELRGRYGDGESSSDLAAEVGMTAKALTHQWRRLGVPTGPQNAPVSDAEVRRMWDALDQGESLDAVASAHERDPRTVQRLLAQSDLDADHHPLVIEAAVERCRREGIRATHEATLLPESTLRRWCRRVARH